MGVDNIFAWTLNAFSNSIFQNSQTTFSLKRNYHHKSVICTHLHTLVKIVTLQFAIICCILKIKVCQFHLYSAKVISMHFSFFFFNIEQVWTLLFAILFTETHREHALGDRGKKNSLLGGSDILNRTVTQGVRPSERERERESRGISQHNIYTEIQTVKVLVVKKIKNQLTII